MILDKTLFHKKKNLLFIDDFENNKQFPRCKLVFDSHCIDCERSILGDVQGAFKVLFLP